MKITHAPSGKVVAENVREARTFFTRLVGLMFVPSPAPYDGLFIEGTNSIHNCFVRFSLDAVFIDDSGTIVKILRDFKPWRFSWVYWKAKHVIELPAGKLGDFVAEGDRLILEH